MLRTSLSNSWRVRWRIVSSAVCAGWLLTGPAGFGQPPSSVPGGAAPPKGAAGTAAAETQAAIIERLPLVLRDPKSYQTPLSLKAATAIDVVAQSDGLVSTVNATVGASIARQAEAMRLESTERQLQVDRAKAALDAMQSSGAQAPQVEVAKLDLRIAEFRLDQTIIRAPFDGTVTTVYVVPGQFVRAGDPLLRLADLRKLTVDIPVDRTVVKTGNSLDVKVEDQSVAGTVQTLQPLLPRFEPLRELFLSVTTAVVTIDNSTGKFSEGQTVYSDLIPRAPVTEVPTLAVGSTIDGNRRVQVIREGFVRDVPVTLLGQAGLDYVFVTGRFGATDELVVKSSKDLRDGMRVLPAAIPTAEGQNRGPNPTGAPATGAPGF
ncbi:MAG: HlyD family efflux transporter periplasmic adaptor subunit [Planctomycetaceae bacterium]